MTDITSYTCSTVGVRRVCTCSPLLYFWRSPADRLCRVVATRLVLCEVYIFTIDHHHYHHHHHHYSSILSSKKSVLQRNGRIPFEEEHSNHGTLCSHAARFRYHDAKDFPTLTRCKTRELCYSQRQKTRTPKCPRSWTKPRGHALPPLLCPPRLIRKRPCHGPQ